MSEHDASANKGSPKTTYDSLGVRRIINANATLTALGGSRMPPSVLQAMGDAATDFVDMFELQERVSGRIADLTHNESALVCNGAASGIVLGILAAMTGEDRGLLELLIRSGANGLQRNQVVMYRTQRIPYDRVIRLTGAEVVEVGNSFQTELPELEAAVGDRTAAILYVAGGHVGVGALSFEETVDVAKRNDIPVIVDAAAQLPPAANLWDFTSRGAEIALFSGGKALRGPQPSGLIVGSARMIRACAMHAAPHQRLGRASKVGKEEMMGLLAAVEWYLDLDHAAEARRIEALTAAWVDHFDNLEGVGARRDFPGEAGRPIPRALITWENRNLLSTRVCELLRGGDPPIDVAVAEGNGIYLSAELLEDAEHEIVTVHLTKIFEEQPDSEEFDDG